jgi:hypothetical protein
MWLCSDGHEEICHEGRSCPACELLQEKKDAESENERLRLQIEKLEEAAAEH